MRFDSILFWAAEGDGLQSALERTAKLAASSQSALTVVEVLEGPPRDMLMLVPSVSAEALQETALEETLWRLDELVAPFKGRSAEIHTKVLFGEPSDKLVQEVNERNHDLLIVNASAAVSLKERLFGRAALRLMRKSACPVWAMKRVQREPCGKIVAAVNPESAEEGGGDASRDVLNVASALARVEGSHLHIVHVWNLFGEKTLRNRARLPAYKIAELLRDAHYSARLGLEKLVSQVDLGGIEYELHLIKGEAKRAIPAFASRNGIDLVVMGMTGRSGVSGLLAGNCAYDVFEALHGSVLTVRGGASLAPLRRQAA